MSEHRKVLLIIGFFASVSVVAGSVRALYGMGWFA